MKRNHNNSVPPNKKLKTDEDNGIFKDSVIHILPARIGKKRLLLLQNQITSHGGTLHNSTEFSADDTVTHVVLEESIDKKIIKNLCNTESFKNAIFVKCTWLIKTIKAKSLIEPNNADIVLEKKDSDEMPTKIPINLSYNASSQSKDEPTDKIIISSSCSDELMAENTAAIKENPVDIRDLHEKPASSEEKKVPTKFMNRFACAHSSSDAKANPNKFITNELEKLASAYQSKKDTWRAVGYQKAIAALKNYHKEIETWEEAKNIRGVGERLADKIKEILEVGKLRKVTEICENEETKTLELFMGVWGAGATTANDWFTQGFRSLEDLETKATLTRHQKIGLKYYADINERMDRAEVQQIELKVREAAAEVKSNLEVVVCGSYRRGKTTCGDVDVLITHPDGMSHEGVFKSILNVLRKSGFLTDDLVVQENNGNQQKYLGVCKLPGSATKHRRLDIIVVPYKEYAPAIMYFTGSAHCNRSMRLLATKMGMSLSEHGLRKNIVRDGKDFVTGGILLDTPTEESIFEHLGLKYRAPNERNH